MLRPEEVTMLRQARLGPQKSRWDALVRAAEEYLKTPLIPEPPGWTDGKWNAQVKDHNIFLRSENETEEIQLSRDGSETNSYARLEWSPDSKALVAWRIEPGDHKEVYLIQSSPAEGGRAILETRPYDLPGDKLTLYQLNVFDPDLTRVEYMEFKPSGKTCCSEFTSAHPTEKENR